MNNSWFTKRNSRKVTEKGNTLSTCDITYGLVYADHILEAPAKYKAVFLIDNSCEIISKSHLFENLCKVLHIKIVVTMFSIEELDFRCFVDIGGGDDMVDIGLDGKEVLGSNERINEMYSLGICQDYALEEQQFPDYQQQDQQQQSSANHGCSIFPSIQIFSSESAIWGGISHEIHDNNSEKEYHLPIYQQLGWDQHLTINDIVSTAATPSIQTCSREVAIRDKSINAMKDAEIKNQKPTSYSLASFELLNSYRGLKKLDGHRSITSTTDSTSTEIARKKLSTEEVIRLAGAKFVHTSSIVEGFNAFNHPYGTSFTPLSEEDKKDVQLVELLLYSAEKFCHKRFNRARNLVNRCIHLSSKEGTSVQRLVHYFGEALLERIDRDTRKAISGSTGKRATSDLSFDASVILPVSNRLACYQEMPFCQVEQFTGLQAIIENVGSSEKIHVIDLLIGTGTQWTILMQALASNENSRLELLKITALGTPSGDLIEDTGKWLTSFAESMNIPFSFNLVIVEDILDLREDHFDIDAAEKVVVFSQFFFRNMIAKPCSLEHMMKVITKIDPCLMVVVEVEANHNSPTLIERFIEALFFCSAFFDCADDCMKKDDQNRAGLESLYFVDVIKNMITAEDVERKIRSVKIDVWRKFFARYSMVEAELSATSLYQARLIVERFNCKGSCTLGMNENCLLIGWKGTPLMSLSVWKFK